MKESYKKIVNEDLRGDAAEIENEVLLVEGERDTTTPPEEAEAYSFRPSKGKDETNGREGFRFCGISRLLQYDCGGIFRS